MGQDKIVVVGARENNLKNVTVEIPRDRLRDLLTRLADTLQ